MPTKKSNGKLVAGILIVLYIILIIPYSIVSSVDKKDIMENGIVVSSQQVSYESFPKGIQDIIQYPNDYNLIVIKDVYSPTKSAVIYQGDQYSPNDFIKIEDINTDLYIDSHYLSFVDKSFNKLITGKVDQVKYGGGLIEFLAYNKLTFLISISKIVFYIGGFFIVFALGSIFAEVFDIWSVSGVIGSYSFQFFIINTLSLLNQENVIAARLTPSIVDALIVPFGYLFILFIPITIIIKKYEATANGEKLIYSLFQSQIRLKRYFISKFSK